jgi:hypothetical protein
MKFRLVQYLLIVVAITLVARCVIGGEVERLLYAAGGRGSAIVLDFLDYDSKKFSM